MMTLENLVSIQEPKQLCRLGKVSVVAVVALAASFGCSESQNDSMRSEPVAGATQELSSCINVPAVSDAILSNPPKNQNFGSLPLLRVGGKDESLIKFELGGIPDGAIINSGTLKLYVNGGSTPSLLEVHAATAAWSESAVTYANFSQQFAVATAGMVNVTSTNVLKSADITQLVISWMSGAQANNGVVLTTASTQKTILVSREGDAALAPVLEICYSTPPVDYCASNPCVHGTCENGESNYSCACAPGWSGANCDINVDDCAENPCLNGGMCTDAVAGYSCSCLAGYAGTNCEIDIDECASMPCQNGGSCTNQVNAYACLCDAGFSGANCEENIDECAGNPCQNGATCTDGTNTYSCTCLSGFTGTHCELNVDDCAVNPCLNSGTCIDGVDSYTCACLPGYGGAVCENNIDECAGNPCLNGGTCIDGVDNYSCTCAPGYSGPECQVDINECVSVSCGNGTCIDGVAGYLCSCNIGYTGAHCDGCAPGFYQNAGTGECISAAGLPSSCASILAAGVSVGDGVYTIAPDPTLAIAPFAVYCDMTTDGGGWTKILQYTTAPFQDSSNAIGNIATASLASAAKLSDQQINAIAAGLGEYRIRGDATALTLFIESNGAFVDSAQGWGFGNPSISSVRACETVSYGGCSYRAIGNNTSWIDTLHWGLAQDDCNRIFMDHGTPQCWGIGGYPSRCMNAGATCGGYRPIGNVIVWLR